MSEINSRQALYRCLENEISIDAVNNKSVELFRYYETGEYSKWSIKLYLDITASDNKNDYIEIRLNSNSGDLENGIYHVDYAKISFDIIIGHKNIYNNISGYYACLPGDSSVTFTKFYLKKEINYGTFDLLLSKSSDVTTFASENDYVKLSTDVNEQVYSIINKDIVANGDIKGKNINITGDITLGGSITSGSVFADNLKHDVTVWGQKIKLANIPNSGTGDPKQPANNNEIDISDEDLSITGDIKNTGNITPSETDKKNIGGKPDASTDERWYNTGYIRNLNLGNNLLIQNNTDNIEITGSIIPGNTGDTVGNEGNPYNTGYFTNLTGTTLNYTNVNTDNITANTQGGHITLNSNIVPKSGIARINLGSSTTRFDNIYASTITAASMSLGTSLKISANDGSKNTIVSFDGSSTTVFSLNEGNAIDIANNLQTTEFLKTTIDLKNLSTENSGLPTNFENNNSYGQTAGATLTGGSQFNIPYFSVDCYGRLHSAGNTAISVSNTPTFSSITVNQLKASENNIIISSPISVTGGITITGTGSANSITFNNDDSSPKIYESTKDQNYLVLNSNNKIIQISTGDGIDYVNVCFEGFGTSTGTSEKTILVASENYVDEAINNSANTINTNLDNHINNKNNPHEVKKDQVGLGAVENYGQTDNPTQNSKLYFTAGGAFSLSNSINMLKTTINDINENFGDFISSCQNKGSATQPIYFNAEGTPTACTYTLKANVPSDAKFTDTTYSADNTTLSLSGTTFSVNQAHNFNWTGKHKFTKRNDNAIELADDTNISLGDGGVILFNGTSFSAASSDERVKNKHFEISENNSDWIDNLIDSLKLYEYNYKDSPDISLIGIMAQDLEKLLPEKYHKEFIKIVNDKEVGLSDRRYLGESKLIYLLLAEVKKLRKEKDNMNKKYEELSKRLERLENNIK